MERAGSVENLRPFVIAALPLEAEGRLHERTSGVCSGVGARFRRLCGVGDFGNLAGRFELARYERRTHFLVCCTRAARGFDLVGGSVKRES